METSRATSASRLDVLLDAGAVALTLVTAAIHLGMGGVLFTLNAAGYLVLAAGLLVPGPVSRIRWLVRMALLGFTAATIGGWLAFGARFPLAYLDKTVELVLMVVLATVIWRREGGLIGIAHRLLGIKSMVARTATGRN